MVTGTYPQTPRRPYSQNPPANRVLPSTQLPCNFIPHISGKNIPTLRLRKFKCSRPPWMYSRAFKQAAAFGRSFSFNRVARIFSFACYPDYLNGLAFEFRGLVWQAVLTLFLAWLRHSIDSAPLSLLWRLGSMASLKTGKSCASAGLCSDDYWTGAAVLKRKRV